MALSPTLRYYRQQFNPEQAYQQQAADSGIISMYNPQELGQFIGATEKRQERFDTAKMAQAQEIARIGEMETYDMAELNNRLKSFEGGINDLVKNKYNGDYSAAANEIAKQIGTERTNPFYHFNKQKVESGKAYLDAKMKLGANFLSTSSPFDVKFQDWQQGKTFDFTPINRNDIVENSASVFGTIANTLMNTPEPQLTADQKFMKVTVQNGLRDPEDVRRFLQTPSGKMMYQQVLDSMPEISNIPNQDAVVDAITQGAYKAIGKADVNYMQNPDYIDAYQRAQIAGKETQPMNIIQDAGILNTPELEKGLKEEQNSMITAYKNDILQDVLKDPKYNSIRSKIKTFADVIQLGNPSSMSDKGTGLSGDFPSVELNPLSKTLNDELDRRTKSWFSGQDKDSKGTPLGIRSFKIVDVFPGMDSQSISAVTKIQDQFETALKPYMIGEKLPPNTSFIGRESKRNSANMDGTQKMTITNIALSPNSKHVIFGISGFSTDKKRLESKISIDLGDSPDPNIAQALYTYKYFAGENSDFAKILYSWLDKFYSK